MIISTINKDHRQIQYNDIPAEYKVLPSPAVKPLDLQKGDPFQIFLSALIKSLLRPQAAWEQVQNRFREQGEEMILAEALGSMPKGLVKELEEKTGLSLRPPPPAKRPVVDEGSGQLESAL